MNIEFILVDVEKKHIDELLFSEFKILNSHIYSSHFYDIERRKDLTIDDIDGFQDIFCKSNTGNVYMEKVNIGVEIKEVMIILSFDVEKGDIIINFPFDELPHNSNAILLIIKYLLNIMKKYKIIEIRIGYESAYDDDMTLHVIKDIAEDVKLIAEKLKPL